MAKGRTQEDCASAPVLQRPGALLCRAPAALNALARALQDRTARLTFPATPHRRLITA